MVNFAARESRDKTEPAVEQPADLTRPAVFVLGKKKKKAIGPFR